MRGAILYTGRFGSTRQYAQWISEATGLSVFDLNRESPDLDNYDYLILGSPIIVMKPSIRRWLMLNWPKIREKPITLFTVSGTEPGHPNLRKWLRDSLTAEIVEKITYVPLRGRLNIKELPWLIRLFLKIGAWREKDPEAKKRMTEGFDFMDRQSIHPILDWIWEQQMAEEEIYH